jgi:hypothetical protein
MWFGAILALEGLWMRHSPAKTSKAASISLLALLLCSPVLASDPPKPPGDKPKSAIEERSSFNLAKLSAEARVVYVSSGSLILARRVIDGNTTTDFSFSSSDFYPTVVVELAQTQLGRKSPCLAGAPALWSRTCSPWQPNDCPRTS